eukprot:942042-Prorocentrum_minimum.AAC.1
MADADWLMCARCPAARSPLVRSSWTRAASRARGTSTARRSSSRPACTPRDVLMSPGCGCPP